jgi:2-amino-4-hydroxy-6-hydroxymethyldihydropteridine diphosphokinase
MNDVYLCLGGNCGKREDYLDKAFWMICKRTEAVSVKASSVYETEAWGNVKLDPFLNIVIWFKTKLDAKQILFHALQIEKELGRKRIASGSEYEARTMDIDILSFNNEIVTEPGLILPHPLMHERRFVLVPLLELNAEWEYPGTKQKVSMLLENCKDKGKVRIFIPEDEYLKTP